MAALPQATPLLLTKRLNAFLRAHTSPSLPTLLLTTHHGKLLAHASSLHQPVAVLRTHATVAASLLAIHTTTSSSTVPPLPTGASPSSSSTSSVALESADLLSATPTTATAKAGETESLTNPGEQQTTATTTTATTANNEGGVAVGAAASAAASTSVVALRRRAAELARWLDEKLGALTVPEDSTGAD
ncbi:hypothetical protein CRV24_001474 [Beauveria bassiana]|nr:hypothetical protein CRV24_001474 [Beauveria bassiana]